jgi:uncharacterized GH25 family protein
MIMKMKMKKALTTVSLLVATLAASANVVAHEMFLRSKESFLTPKSDQVIRLINGTFDKSDNSISRDRMADVRIVANGKAVHPEESSWYDDENSSYLNWQSTEEGTYVIGVSTHPRVITMSPDDFMAYLRHDGVLDTLKVFKKENKLAEVQERYSKHIRSIVQVGNKRTPDHKTKLGYPVEIIPDQNPYELRFGHKMSFQVLFKGKPAANQPVRASYEGFHGHDASGGHINSYDLRTDADGRASFLLNNKALWYISLIHMEEKPDDPDVDYESNWATLTFEVK